MMRYFIWLVIATATTCCAIDMGKVSIPTNSLTIGSGTNVAYSIENNASDITTLQATDATHTTDISSLETRADNAEINIYLNAFRISAGDSLSQAPMEDGYIDVFTDESGIDTGAGSNYIYSAAGDYYEWTFNQVAALTNLEVHIKMNDNAANTVVDDSSYNDSDYTLLGGDNTADLTAAGKINQCLRFDGAADSISNAFETLASGSFTVAMWFKVHTMGSGARDLFSIHVNSYNNYWALGSWNGGSGSLGFSLYDGSNNPGANFDAGTITTDIWYHYCAVRDTVADTITVYLNASIGSEADNPETDTTTSVPAYKTMHIGGTPPPNRWAGAFIDDFRFYNYALTPEAITNLYYNGEGRETTNGIDVGGNIELISTNFWVSTAPTEGKLMLLVQDDDSDTTINTDLKGYISNNAGTNWDEVTLSDDGEYSSGVSRWSSPVTTFTGTSSNIMWRVKTFNTKDGYLNGSALQVR